MAKTNQGQNYTWQIEAMLGSGDAGEVFAVTSPALPEVNAVLKRPGRIASGGTMLRQGAQIQTEGEILARLNGLDLADAFINLHTPRLLDASPAGTEQSSHYFIVSEKVAGVSVQALLRQQLEAQSSTPVLLALRVLWGLLRLLVAVHSQNIIWNDVKLEHIFWDETHQTLSFIDWGNGVITSQPGQALPITPEQDYRQMFQEMRQFLMAVDEAILSDLGWDEFSKSDLSKAQCNAFLQRLKFTMQYYTLRTVENRRMGELISTGNLNKSDLDEWLRLLQQNQRLGVSIDLTELMQQSHQLMLHLAQNQQADACLAVNAKMMTLSPEPAYRLLQQCLNQPTLQQSQWLPQLVAALTQKHWRDALWFAAKAQPDFEQDWWQMLAARLRHAAEISTPTPLQALTAMQDFLAALLIKLNQSALPEEVSQRTSILAMRKLLAGDAANWQQLPLTHPQYVFSEAFLEAIKSLGLMRLDEVRQVRQLQQQLDHLTRQTLTAWHAADINAVQQLLRQFFIIDPDRQALLRLSDQLDAFEQWQMAVQHGLPNHTPAEAAQILLDTRPPIDQALGKPPWLQAWDDLLLLIARGEDWALYADGEVANRLPWLFTAPPTPLAPAALPPLTAHQLHQLDGYYRSLKTWGDLSGQLVRLKPVLPEYFTLYETLVERFKGCLTPHWHPAAPIDLHQFPVEDHPSAHTALLVLEAIETWRSALMNGYAVEHINLLNHLQFQDWRLYQHIIIESEKWNQSVMPMLQSFPATPADVATIDAGLQSLPDDYQQMLTAWQASLACGFSDNGLSQIAACATRLKTTLNQWMQHIQDDGSSVQKLLYYASKGMINTLNDNFQRIIWHINAALAARLIVSSSAMPRTRLMLDGVDNLMHHLHQLDALLLPGAGNLDAWYTEYQTYLQLNQREEQLAFALQIDQNHPLLTWMITFAQNEQ